MFSRRVLKRKIKRISSYGPQHHILKMRPTFPHCIPYHLFRNHMRPTFSRRIRFSYHGKCPDLSSNSLCAALVAGSVGLIHLGVDHPSTRLMTQSRMLSLTAHRFDDRTRQRLSGAVDNNESTFNHSGSWIVSTVERFYWRSRTCKARPYPHISAPSATASELMTREQLLLLRTKGRRMEFRRKTNRMVVGARAGTPLMSRWQRQR